MSATLTAAINITGSGSLSDPSSSTEPSSAVESVNIGTTLSAIAIAYTSGTADSKCNQWYCAQRTVTAGGNVDLDLNGSLTNKITGAGTIAFTKVRCLILVLRSKTATTDYLKVGPQNVANGWTGPFSVATANGWIRVDRLFVLENPTDNGIGAVTAGSADVLRLNNPGANDITVDIWALGVE